MIPPGFKHAGAGLESSGSDDFKKKPILIIRKEEVLMKQMLRISAACLIVVIMCFAILTVDADAQSFTTSRPGGRAGSWDFFMPLTYNPSSNWSGQSGSTVDLNATWGFGFGFGYNITDHFQVNGLFSWSARNYDATIVNANTGAPSRYSNTLYSSTFSLNGIWYILEGNISPFVSGGLGVTYLDTNIQSGAGSTTCWWDPWYGYVCGSSAPTKTESDVSYNVGLGVRFDLSRQFALQPSYSKVWLDRGSNGTPDFDVWRLDFVFRM
jgi:opacity protein-like surface antigen